MGRDILKPGRYLIDDRDDVGGFQHNIPRCPVPSGPAAIRPRCWRVIFDAPAREMHVTGIDRAPEGWRHADVVARSIKLRYHDR
jgi:hypothetical protein